ncbi:MAG: FecR family protein [Burkholderiaceae bacterium]|jgi:hypothetical protein
MNNKLQAMKKSFSLAIFCLPLFLHPAHAGDGHVGLVRELSGKVTIQRNGASLAAAVGTPIMQSDTLVSSADGSAGLTFEDGTLLTLGPSSELDLRQYVFEPSEAKYAFSVYLRKGTAIYSSGKLGKIAPSAVNVETPKAIVGVRGTKFLVEVD